jgi:hypothetical protein
VGVTTTLSREVSGNRTANKQPLLVLRSAANSKGHDPRLPALSAY